MPRTIAMLLLLTACNPPIDAQVDASLPAALPEVLDELPASAIDEQPVGLDLVLRFTSCKDGKLDAASSVTGQTRALAVGDRSGAIVSGGAFIDGRWRHEDGISLWGARDLGADESVKQTAPHEWIIDATRRASRHPGEYTFAVAYEHRVAERLGEGAAVSTSHFEISLSEGEALTLDALQVYGGGAGCQQTATIALVPRVGVPGHEADDRILQYELWFVDEAPDGTAKWTHATFGGLHGERVPYRLPSVRMPVEVAGVSRDLLFGSDGGLRGRWRDDGAIDLIVEGELWHSLVETGEARNGGLGQTGKHAFRVEPGRVLRLEFEPGAGSGSFGVVGADGVQRTVGLEALREGHRTALLVAVKQAEAHG